MTRSLVVGFTLSSLLLSTTTSPLAILALTASYSSTVKVRKFQLPSAVGRPTYSPSSRPKLPLVPAMELQSPASMLARESLTDSVSPSWQR